MTVVTCTRGLFLESKSFCLTKTHTICSSPIRSHDLV